MTVEYKIIPSLRLVYQPMARPLDIEELISHLEYLAADENYIPPMKKIVDFTNVDRTPQPKFSFSDYERLSEFFKNRMRGERLVIVTPTDYRFGMGRMFESKIDNSNIEVMVVRSLKEALALLDIEETDFRELIEKPTE